MPYSIETNKKVLDQSKEITKGILSGKFATYIDDHNSGNEVVNVDGFVVIHHWGETENFWVCPISSKWKYFCLNNFYISEEGNLHLSTRSVSGNVAPANYDMDMVRAISQYSIDCPNKKAVDMWLKENMNPATV